MSLVLYLCMSLVMSLSISSFIDVFLPFYNVVRSFFLWVSRCLFRSLRVLGPLFFM